MSSIWGELKRRNVVKVAVAYAIVAWLLIEVTSTVFPLVQLPEWTATFVTMLLLIGFPIALILSWAYELTPDGMKKSHEVPATESIAQTTGRKIDFAIIGALMLALGFVVYNYVLNAPATSPIVEQDRPSVAALPFSNESAAEENAEFFANGIHDELLTQLAKISSLKVISRTSVMEYRDTTKNMREIGQELGVATLLEGRVQRAGDMVRINVQLIDAETDEHLWAETYNREITAENIFAIQGEMAASIAAALQAAMTPREVALLNRAPTDSARAYDFYLSGNDYFSGADDRNLMPLAVQQYGRAVAEDPSFALAWAALARAHGLMHWYALDRTDARLELALGAVERAFELAPGLPEAHVAMGYYHYQGFRDYEKALVEFDLAEQGMPGAAILFEVRAYVQRRMGEHELAAVNLGQAIDRDPRNIDLLLQQSNTYWQLGRYEQAEQNVERAFEIAPDSVAAYRRRVTYPLYGAGNSTLTRSAVENANFDIGEIGQLLGWTAALYDRDYGVALAYLDDWESETIEFNDNYYPKAGMYGVTYSLAGQPEAAMEHFDAARAQVEGVLETYPDDARLYVALGEAMVGLGASDQGVELADRAMEVMPKSRDANAGAVIQQDAIMRVYLPAGADDAAIENLDDYLSAPGWWSIEGLLPDPRLDRIRNDPRFQALVEKYRRQ